MPLNDDIRAALGDHPSVIEVLWHPAVVEGHPLARELEALALILEELGVELTRTPPRVESAKAPPQRPAVTLSSKYSTSRVHVLAAPVGPEREPFLDALRRLGSARGCGEQQAGRSVSLVVFVTPSCPLCPSVVRDEVRLVLSREDSALSVVDATKYPELSRRFAIRSAPTTVIDEGWSVVGATGFEELTRLIDQRGTKEWERGLLASLIEVGRHEDATAGLLRGEALEPFAEIWRRSTLHQRIPLMIVATDALELRRGALDELVPRLLGALDDEDLSRRGDTLDLLGRIGHFSARGALDEASRDPNPDIAEAASEALAQLDIRAGAASWRGGGHD